MFSKLVKGKDNIFDVLKSIVFSLLFSIIFVLVFAIFVKYLSLGEEVIVPVNYVIKVLSILLGCLFGYKNREKGAVKGLFTGILYYLFSILLFSLFSGNFDLIKINWIDILCLILSGIISGIITVNIKK